MQLLLTRWSYWAVELLSSFEMDHANDNETSLPGASERIQRILSSTALSRLSTWNSGRVSPSVPVTQTRLGGNAQALNTQEEMAQAFPALYRTQAYPYNPQRNYCPPSRPGPSRERRSMAQASGSRRSGPSHHPYQQKPSIKNFVKKVVLVEPGEIIIPKGRKRQQACDEGRVVDMMEFQGDWTEIQTISAI